MNYTIIDQTEVPARGKWRGLVLGLPPNKALRVDGLTHPEAKRLRATIVQCFRLKRTPNIKVHTRMVAVKDDFYSLYVWRESK